MSGLGKLAGIMSTAALGAGAAAYIRYRREIRTIRAAIEAGGTVAQTSAGPIEYAEEGVGQPLLLIHGAGGGYDQGLLVGRDIGADFRIIAPSPLFRAWLDAVVQRNADGAVTGLRVEGGRVKGLVFSRAAG